MAISQANKIERTNIPSLGHGAGIYLATITSTTGTTTDISAVGDVVLTFPAKFRSVPKILSCSLQNGQTGTTTIYPTVWVKTVTQTTLTVTLGGLVGTMADARILVLMEAEA